MGKRQAATSEAMENDESPMRLPSFAGGGAPGGPGGSRNSESAILSWVEAHFTATTIGGQTVYNLTVHR